MTVRNVGGNRSVATSSATVANMVPMAVIQGAPVTGHSPEGTVLGSDASASDPSPAAAAAGFAYTWTVTKNGTSFASGTTAQFTFTPDDDGEYVVSLTITDKDGAASQTATATVAADNVAPTAGLSDPTAGARGQTQTFTLTAADPSAADRASGFTFQINWGDGTTQTVIGSSGRTVGHVFAAAGSYTVRLTAKNKNGGTSPVVSRSASLRSACWRGRSTRPRPP